MDFTQLTRAQLEDILFVILTQKVWYENPYPGKLINFDSIDGAGSSSQVNLLAEYLQGRGASVFITKEPTSLEIGKKIREVLQHKWELDPLPFQQIFCGDRGDHLAREVIPALKSGKWVVTDRYALSTVAFGTANGVPTWLLIGNNVYYPWPDLNIVFVLSPEEALRRIEARGEKKELHEVQETLEKTLAAYKMIGDYLPNIALVDATGTPEEVFARVKKIVDETLNPIG